MCATQPLNNVADKWENGSIRTVESGAVRTTRHRTSRARSVPSCAVIFRSCSSSSYPLPFPPLSLAPEHLRSNFQLPRSCLTVCEFSRANVVLLGYLVALLIYPRPSTWGDLALFSSLVSLGVLRPLGPPRVYASPALLCRYLYQTKHLYLRYISIYNESLSFHLSW